MLHVKLTLVSPSCLFFPSRLIKCEIKRGRAPDFRLKFPRWEWGLGVCSLKINPPGAPSRADRTMIDSRPVLYGTWMRRSWSIWSSNPRLSWGHFGTPSPPSPSWTRLRSNDRRSQDSINDSDFRNAVLNFAQSLAPSSRPLPCSIALFRIKNCWCPSTNWKQSNMVPNWEPSICRHGSDFERFGRFGRGGKLGVKARCRGRVMTIFTIYVSKSILVEPERAPARA